MSASDLAARLHHLSLFADLTPDELNRFAAGAEVQHFARGAVLFHEHEQRLYLRMIEQGRVDVSKTTSFGTVTHLISYGKDDFLAEGVLLGESVHSTTAIAAEPTTCVAFHRDFVHRTLESEPPVRAKILTQMLHAMAGRLNLVAPPDNPEALPFASGRTRLEHDLLGTREVPADAYYGIQTARAIDNFKISGTRLLRYPELIKALAVVKMAAAHANRACGLLSDPILQGIDAACQELIDGKLHGQFVLDVMQGGAGTSTNMNANEVISNRALELMGHQKGEYRHCDPHNHVNCSQSTNDAYPTALKLAMVFCNDELVRSMRDLIAAFRTKAHEFRNVIKMGRTQLQDAVPMTLGQVFEAYAASLSQEVEGLQICARLLLSVNMGGTAIGTGINAPKDYPAKVIDHLRRITGLDIRLSANLIEATQDTQAYVVYSSGLKSLAIKLSKICNDLRLLSSGPRCGIGEIHLPPMQPGSSIMPGKVNPVIPEVVNQVCFKVIGNDLTVTLAAEAGQLELNVMEPVMAACILESVKMFKNAAQSLRWHCVLGIIADEARCREYVERSIGVVTALNPVLGYEISSQLATEALKTGRGIVELIREKKLLTEEQIAQLLDPATMAGAPRPG